jgi:hypothetical protein
MQRAFGSGNQVSKLNHVCVALVFTAKLPQMRPLPFNQDVSAGAPIRISL